MLTGRELASWEGTNLSELTNWEGANLRELTGVSYKWFPSVAGLQNLYSVIDGKCTLKVENTCNTENTFYMKQAVANCEGANLKELASLEGANLRVLANLRELANMRLLGGN